MNLHDPGLRSSERRFSVPIKLPGDHHVAIMMAIHNGASWLPEQLQSLLDQTHEDWSLLVGDDGSKDAGPAQINAFAIKHPDIPVRFFEGQGLGFQANFMRLLMHLPRRTPFAAFCDQDDVWDRHKLNTAVEAMAQVPADVPVLYCGRTLISDADLAPLGLSPDFRRPPSFENALVQSIAGGNTMVMNRAAIDLLKQAYDPDHLPISHDWWAYQIIAGAGGHVIFDAVPRVIYRQHGANQVGSGRGWAAKLERLGRLLRGDFQRFNTTNLRALKSARALLSDKNREVLQRFESAREQGLLKRVRMFRKLGLRRQTRFGNIALWLAIVLRKV